MSPFSVLRDTWYFFSRHLGMLLPLCLPWVLLESLLLQQIRSQVEGPSAIYWSLIGGLLFYPLYTASLILFVMDCEAGRQRSLLALWRQALRLWPAFTLLAALSALLILVGLSFMVLPGILIMVKLAFAEFLLVQNKQSPLEAMSGSVRQTTGHFFVLLTGFMAVLAPLWLIEISLNPLGAAPEVLLDSLSGFCRLLLTLFSYRVFRLASKLAR